MDVMGDNRTYNPGSGPSSPSGPSWDQSAGGSYDGETDASLLLLPGSVNFGGLTNAADVTFNVTFALDAQWSLSSGGVAGFRVITVTPVSTLISDGWNVAISPSGNGSYDGDAFTLVCVDTATGLTQFGPHISYLVSPQEFGFVVSDGGTAILAYASAFGDYYDYNYATASSPFTLFCYPYGYTSTGTFPFSWVTATDADAGITFTPLSNGSLQIDVDLSLMTMGTGLMSVQAIDDGTGGSSQTYPRTGSTHNLVGGNAVTLSPI